ncbi:MAG: hypothetical protein K6B70_01315 [Clostridia bacterium]|nr:hypothetical protein [Clostridia bacterium]
MKLQTTQKDGKLYGKLPDTGWVDIQFSSNDWKPRASGGYHPKFRKIGNVVFLQGQFATQNTLNAGTYNIVTTNLPKPQKQHTLASCSYLGELVCMWITGKTITFKLKNSLYDDIGVSIDSCYITD